MNKSVYIAFCLGILLLIPSLSAAECGSIGGFDRFTLEGMNTVTLYSGSRPVARFDVQNCNVQPESRIDILKSDVCDGDNVQIDGYACTMMEIKPMGP